MTSTSFSQQESQPVKNLEQKFETFREKLSGKWWIEIGILTLVSILTAFLFSRYARGGVNSSDISLYLNLGMNGIKFPFVLNRYFHIFIQQIFVGLAPTPLEGYHAYWGFLIGLNTFMIFLTARKIRKGNTIFHGILAVLLFFGMSALSEISGVVVVDLSAMTMLMAVFMFYVLSMNQGHDNHWLIVGIGFLLFLAFKTKETTLPVLVLLPGLGWVKEKGFNWKTLILNLLWVVCGAIAGMIFFAILSWLFLGDPLFGLRISEWKEFYHAHDIFKSNFHIAHDLKEANSMVDWYRGYWFKITLLPFLLYLISGVKGSREKYFGHKLLYLVPLTYVVFLLISINNNYGHQSRFGLPALPVLSVLAVQFLELNAPTGKRIKYWSTLSIGMMFIFVGRLALWIITSKFGWEVATTISLFFYPLLLTMLFVSLVLFDNNVYGDLVNFLIIILLLFSTHLPLNFRAMFVDRKNEVIFAEVVKPLTDFKSEIQFTPSMRFYVTSDTFERASIRILKDHNELLSLFNVLFNANSTKNNFSYANITDNISNDITYKRYDYVLITNEQWENILDDEIEKQKVLKIYQQQSSSDGSFILLTPLE